uniref:Immunoglobulin V-set domain-containing protein n=1 Tax=Poecilia mexicana TaxID=48701 RepID=A0A3B3Y8H7_9TELE
MKNPVSAGLTLPASDWLNWAAPSVKLDAGSSLTVACSFGSSGKTKYFCRGGCEEEENILVYTDGVRAQSGRYSIGHSKHKSSDVFYVTIKNLTQSDSGRYRCLSYLSAGKNLYVDFNIVTNVSSETTDPSPLDQNYRATSTDLPLIVIVVTLAVIVVLLSAALIVSYRKRSLRGEKAADTLLMFTGFL